MKIGQKDARLSGKVLRNGALRKNVLGGSLKAKLAAFAVLTTLAGAAYAQTKVAVVDTQRAIMETEDGLRMQATLKKLFDSKQRELDGKQTELEQERADIEKQKGALSQDALQRRAEKWQREMASLQQVFVDYNKELQKKQNELTQPIFQKTMGLIRRLATQEGFDIVVDKQAVPYVRSDLDLTDRVITLYNGGAPAAAGEAKPEGAAPKAPAAPAAPAVPPTAPKK
jgi:outer membrane protein